MEVKLVVNENNNIPPTHHECKRGGFFDITICQDCGSVGYEYDQHIANCCNNCGGQIVRNGSGKWDENTQKWLIKTRE